MKFLVIAQDLRVSGTSEGIVSRSFLSKLRKAYAQATINVLYLKSHDGNDQLELLPVDSIETHVLNLKVPFFTLWCNKLYWRLFHRSLKERYILKVYASHIAKVDFKRYNHVFIRSSGINHETLLATKQLPILEKAIINFHDPFPFFWYSGKRSNLSNLELFRLKDMGKVVAQAKRCISPSSLLSQDMQFLYGSVKTFYTLPHQFDKYVFNFTDISQVLTKQKKVTISYHGAIMFGRNIDILLDAYIALLERNSNYEACTEFILRLRGQDNTRIRAKYAKCSNIMVLDTLNFSNSCYEQTNGTDIHIILENGPFYSDILVGKSAFLASLNKPILSISPQKSELRNLIKDERFIASNNNQLEIEQKLEVLINDRLHSNDEINPFGDYFGEDNFKRMLDVILVE